MHALTSLMRYSCIEHNVNSSIFAPQGNTFKLQTLSVTVTRYFQYIFISGVVSLQNCHV